MDERKAVFAESAAGRPCGTEVSPHMREEGKAIARQKTCRPYPRQDAAAMEGSGPQGTMKIPDVTSKKDGIYIKTLTGAPSRTFIFQNAYM